MILKVSHEVELQERWCEVFPNGLVRAHADEHVFESIGDLSPVWCAIVWLGLRNADADIWREGPGGSWFTGVYVRRLNGEEPTEHELEAYRRATARRKMHA